jgi:hypothetical protein
MKHQLLILAFCCLFSNARAYPITPISLFDLVQNSELIVSGYVTEISKDETSRDKIATIAIHETLKGNLKDNTVKVLFTHYIICPAPARYHKGEYVLAFLNLSSLDYYHTYGMSYGVKHVDGVSLKIYSQRTREAINAFKNPSEISMFDALVECAISCLEEEVTRFESYRLLNMESDFFENYLLAKQSNVGSVLNESQKERLCKALLKIRPEARINFTIVDLAYKGNERIIKDFLSGRLKDYQDDPWNLENYFRILSEGNPSKKIAELVNRSKNIYEEEQATKLIVEFMSITKQ